MFQGRVFMIISHAKLKTYQLKYELSQNIIDYEESTELSKVLNLAIKNMPQDIDDDKFSEYLDTTFDLIDRICFIIIEILIIYIF